MASVQELMQLMRAAVELEGKALVDKVKGVICYNISGKEYTLALKEGAGAFYEGRVGVPGMCRTFSHVARCNELMIPESHCLCIRRLVKLDT
jgi:hypothetical protein